MLDRRQTAIAARKARIVDAARAALEADGHEPSVRALAMNAGLSVATLYNLFGSKEAILVAVLDPEIDKIDAMLGAQRDAEPLRRAEALLEASLRHFIRNARLFRPLLGAIERQGPSSARAAVMQRSAMLLVEALGGAAQRGQLSDDVPPDLVARQIIWGYVQAIRYWAAGDLSHPRFRAQVRSVFALGLLSIAKGKARAPLIQTLAELAPTLRSISRS